LFHFFTGLIILIGEFINPHAAYCAFDKEGTRVKVSNKSKITLALMMSFF